MDPKGIIIIFAGLFAVICAIGNWDWFMGNRKARIWLKLFGRNGARIFYILLGGALATVGALLSAGIIK